MRLPKALLAALLLPFLLSPALPAEPADLPTVDQLLAKMSAAASKIQTYEADVRETAMLLPLPGARIETRHIAIEKFERDGKTFERSYRTVETADKDAKGKPLITKSKSVSDGASLWIEQHSSRWERVFVTKTALEAQHLPELGSIVTDSMDHQAKDYHLKIVGDDTIDGQKMYVLEGALDKAPADHSSGEVKGKFWVGQEDLVIHREIGSAWMMDIPVISTTNYTNIKINQPIDPKLFQYTPPEGAVVTDNTQPKP